MRPLRLAFLAPLALVPLLSACPTEPEVRAKEPVFVEDEWTKMAPSKEWLHATSTFNGDHKAECAHVLDWVKGEDHCRASLCEHGRDLAAEWLERCASYSTKTAQGEVKELKDKLAERATEKPTDCGKQYELMLRDGCGEDATCEVTGQKWATRCAKAEASPLVMRLLEKTIERKLTEPATITLDDRTCDEIRADVVVAASCKDRFACGEAIPKVEAYRARCESDEARPTISTAVLELTVIVGGGQPGQPIATRAGGAGILPDEGPVVLADGSGAVIQMCDERASNFARYFEERKACSGGKIVVARAFKTARGVEVRVGSLDFPNDATFSARYPTILGARELELRDKDEAAAFEVELGKAMEQARSATGAAEAARLLAKAVHGHAGALRRSAAFRAALTAHDEALAPALKELGRIKLAATKGRVVAADANGLLQRAKTRAFADIDADGTVQMGAPTPGSHLDTTALLPRGMDAYLAALKATKPRKLDKKVTSAAKDAGTAAAGTCGAWERRLQESKLSLINCAFGLETCDDTRMGTLLKSVDDARASAEAAYHQLDLARTGGAEGDGDELTAAATAAGCREPWW